MPMITFEPLAISISADEGETLFAAARRHDVPIPTACVGRGTCGLCRVKVLEGAALLSEMNATEKRHLGNSYFITKLRLSCQARLQVPATATAEAAPAGVRVLIPDARRR